MLWLRHFRGIVASETQVLACLEATRHSDSSLRRCPSSLEVAMAISPNPRRSSEHTTQIGSTHEPRKVGILDKKAVGEQKWSRRRLAAFCVWRTRRIRLLSREIAWSTLDDRPKGRLSISTLTTKDLAFAPGVHGQKNARAQRSRRAPVRRMARRDWRRHHRSSPTRHRRHRQAQGIVALVFSRRPVARVKQLQSGSARALV